MDFTRSMSAISQNIREEPDIKQLLSRMPESVVETLSDEQLIHLKTAIGSRNWGKHTVDIRGTFSFPFTRWRYYYVVLLGRNRRQLSAREKRISALMVTAFIIGFILFSTLLGILVLYLIKSFVGIDIFPNFSFGVWDYFKDNFM